MSSWPPYSNEREEACRRGEPTIAVFQTKDAGAPPNQHQENRGV
nr:hypothetical protein Iba_chr09eCG12250 [Ipomoea batatas]